MQLGIRLHDTKKLPLEGRIEDVKNLGFKCGHLALGKVIDEFPTTDEAMTPGLAMYVKNVFAKNNVDIAVLGCYLNLADPNEAQLKKTMHRYMAHIRFASWLGCGVVGTETGCPNETYTHVPECHNEESLQLFQEGTELVRSCGKLLDDAELQVKMVMTDETGMPVMEDFRDEP